MATVINNPGEGSGGDGMGFLMGAIVLIVVVFLFILYGLPALRGAGTVNTTPQINVPDSVDVNLNQGTSGQ